MVDIQNCGARSGGEFDNTSAIQQALDSCAATGGGTVRIGPGVWMSYTLYLHDNTTLHLEEGAVLLGGAGSSSLPGDCGQSMVDSRPLFPPEPTYVDLCGTLPQRRHHRPGNHLRQCTCLYRGGDGCSAGAPLGLETER